MKALVVVFSIALTVYAAICLVMFLAQRSLLYIPTVGDLSPPRDKLAGVKKETLTTDDAIDISAWFVPPASPEHKTILYAHGNAGNLHDRIDKFERFTARGYGLLAFSYRGYGDSQGSPSETGLVKDYKASWDFLRLQGIEDDKIICYGESLGTGVSIEALAEYQLAPAFIVLEAPFTSVTSIASAMYPWLPVRALLRDRYNTVEHLDNIRSPILVIHGEQDALIPISQGQMVYEHARSRKAFRPLPETAHTDFDPDLLVNLISSFEEDLIKKGPYETLIQSRESSSRD